MNMLSKNDSTVLLWRIENSEGGYIEDDNDKFVRFFSYTSYINYFIDKNKFLNNAVNLLSSFSHFCHIVLQIGSIIRQRRRGKFIFFIS